jgi:glycosyltransferase involved in cell wall biosynthesis
MADVSVVIATRNRAPLLKESLESVLSQSEPVRELFVVDDGSTDDTKSLLANYGERVTVISQSQSGAPAARNRAIRAAQGEWIAFLDDDDVWLKTKIERQMAVANTKPDLGIVYCGVFDVDEQLRMMSEHKPLPENRGDAFERMAIKNFLFTSCVMARRKAIEEAGYMDINLIFAEDWDLWLKIAARYTVDFSDEPLVLCRHSPACLTKETKIAIRLRDMETVRRRAMTLRTMPAAVQRRARYELRRQQAMLWLLQGNQWRACSRALQLVATEPAMAEGYRLLGNSIVPCPVRDWAKRVLHRS